MLVLSFWRLFIYFICNNFKIKSNLFTRFVRKHSIIIGLNNHSQIVGKYLDKKSSHSYKFVGFISSTKSIISSNSKFNIIGQIDDLLAIIDKYNINVFF